MFLLYNLILPFAFLLYLPYYLCHIIHRGGLTREYWQRFGIFGRALKAHLRALKAPVWIHAVSVGESVAALTFIKAWQRRHPEDDIVFSCSTATAHETIQKKNLPGVTLIYCPIDFHWAVCHALRLIHPKALVIFEVEIWPNLILQAAKRGVKVCLVNGRMSDKSSRGYAKWSGVFKPIFNAFAVICVQTAEDATRVERVIGPSPHIKVCDTMKFDQVPDMNAADVGPVLERCFGPEERLTFVAGSTHPGEEELLCDAFLGLKQDFPQLRMVLVPRHCERTPEVVELLRAKGLTYALLKPREGDPPHPTGVNVLIVNTTGELMNFYGAADVAYVGKSMAGQTGGHNIIEPAIFGKAILHGPHMENFRAVAAIFRERRAAIEVPEDKAFANALRALLADASERAALGERARKTVERYHGAIERTLDAIDNTSPNKGV